MDSRWTRGAGLRVAREKKKKNDDGSVGGFERIKVSTKGARDSGNVKKLEPYSRENIARSITQSFSFLKSSLGLGRICEV